MVFGLAQLRGRNPQSRGRAFHFIYRVRLLEIKPWPSPQQASVTSSLLCANSFALRWHRGGRRSGVAQSCTVYGAPHDGIIPFNHNFELPVTLYCTSSSAFKEKLIIFALLDSEHSTGPPLARGTLDLASYGTSGTGNNDPITTPVPVPLIFCTNSLLKAGIPNLHLLITPSPCKQAYFGLEKFQTKAHYLANYLLRKTAQLLRKKEAVAPPLSSHAHEALVAALLEEGDECKEEEWEAEIEPFTDDESSSGLHTPREEKSSHSESKLNTATVESDNTPRPVSSRVSIAEVGMPTLKRPHSDEAFPSFLTSSCGTSSLTLPITSERTLAEDIRLDAAKRSGGSTECPTERCGHIESHIDDEAGAQCRVCEAEALRIRIISQLHESKVCRLNLDDLDSELAEENDIFSVKGDTTVLEEARRIFAEGAEKRDAKLTKMFLEETKAKLAEVEAQSVAVSEKVSFLQLCIGGLEGELQDVAVIETIIFCTVAEHAETCCSVLTCACLLTKLHKHAFTNWSHQRRASLMRNTFLGLVLAARACGQDVARLTFWWSNVLALRHACFLALEPVSLPPSSEIVRGPSQVGFETGKASRSTGTMKSTLPVDLAVLGTESCDWGDPTVFCSALQKVEAWIYAKVVDAVWFQVFAPLAHCEELLFKLAGTCDGGSKDLESKLLVFDLENEMPQNSSIDIWKKAYLDALQKLCPVQIGGKACGCVPGLPRQVMEECIARLDVLMFNAVLPTSETDSSYAEFSTPALPIPPRHLTFGAGVQLKNVVSTWSTWLTITLEKLDNTAANAVTMDESRRFISFPLLKALADLLMLPRDMVADKCVRKEVCPVFTLSVVQRIISNVEPDEFAPDAVSPSVLAALNAELEMEKRMYGDGDEHGFSAYGMALEPRVAYGSQKGVFRDIGERILKSVVSGWVMQDDGVGDVFHGLKMLLSESSQAFSEVMLGTFDQGQDSEKHVQSSIPLHRYKLLQELCAPEFKQRRSDIDVDLKDSHK